MEYVPVIGIGPTNSITTPIKQHFKSYLISLAEPTTSRAWTLQDIYKQMQKIKKRRLGNLDLYIDSGGFQILQGYITENRIKEYVDVYHFILEKFNDDIDYVFSLDINNQKFSKEDLFKYNDYSIDSSIEMIRKYPVFRDKQLFVIQSRTTELLEDWKELMDNHKIYDYYDRFSMGGLVGLKKNTRAQFNHFVITTLWLATYIQNRRKNNTPFPAGIKHIHMLGQSSRVAMISGAILEKLLDIKITMDSSEIIRFTPIVAKTPMIHKLRDVDKPEFNIVGNLQEMGVMVAAHSDPTAHEEMEKLQAELLKGKVSNQTFVEVISQNLSNIISFSDHMLQELSAEEIVQWDADQFEAYHDIFKIGRLSTEMANNMRLIRTLKPYYDDNNFEGIHDYTTKIINNYYSGNGNKTGELNE